MKTYTFAASDLMDRHGFSDGDIMEDFSGSNDENLIAIVESVLLPRLDPRVKLERIICVHNQCRATPETWQFIDRNVSVTLMLDEMLMEGFEYIGGME